MRYVGHRKMRTARDNLQQEFIIRTRRARHPDVFVSRRYGDFRTLADEVSLLLVYSSDPLEPPLKRLAIAAQGTPRREYPTTSSEGSHVCQCPFRFCFPASQPLYDTIR